MQKKISRREFIRLAGLTAAGSALAASAPKAAPTEAPVAPAAITQAPAVVKPTEIIHWSWLAASDGEVWKQMIDSFNEANKDKNISIKMEVIPEEQFVPKVVGAAATGQAPDFGWGTAGLRAKMIKDGVIVPQDDYASKVGLDLTDFTDSALKASRYPTFGNKLYMTPMDAMSLQMEVNLDHVKEAGLDETKPPTTGEELLTWAKAMTKLDGDKVTRSGIMMTGSGVQPTVTWGIVARQMGFLRASDDLKQAAIDPEAGKKAMQWVLGSVRHTKSLSPRCDGSLQSFRKWRGFDVLDRTLDAEWLYNPGLEFYDCAIPQYRRRAAYLLRAGRSGNVHPRKTRGATRQPCMRSSGYRTTASCGLQRDSGAEAVRKSVLAKSDYNTAGSPWKVHGRVRGWDELCN